MTRPSPVINFSCWVRITYYGVIFGIWKSIACFVKEFLPVKIDRESKISGYFFGYDLTGKNVHDHCISQFQLLTSPSPSRGQPPGIFFERAKSPSAEQKATKPRPRGKKSCAKTPKAPPRGKTREQQIKTLRSKGTEISKIGRCHDGIWVSNKTS